MLQCGQALPFAADQGAQRLTLLAGADHVQSARLARLDLDLDVEAKMSHELLEDCLAGRKGLRRCLRSFEIGTFSGE